MSSFAIRLLAVVLGVSLAFAAAADAKTRKDKKAVAAVAKLDQRTDKFPTGPVYAYGLYMGDDPDPFIRLMLLRDAAARLDGAQ